jgi:hypothetical protein
MTITMLDLIPQPEASRLAHSLKKQESDPQVGEMLLHVGSLYFFEP